MTRVKGGPDPTVLDLFAGAGGFALGFELAGFCSLGAVEIDEVASATLRNNLGQRPLDRLGPECGDITALDPEEVARELRRLDLELDVLTAGPPCQGFSRVGRGKLDHLSRRNSGAFHLDERNGLYQHAILWAEALRPSVVVFENVTGILHMRGRNVAQDVCNALSDTGYQVAAAMLNAAWFGVPQTRERVFIIGVRKDLGLDPVFPAKSHDADLGLGSLCRDRFGFAEWDGTHSVVDTSIIDDPRPVVTVREAIGDLPPFLEHLQAARTGRVYRAVRGRPGVAYRRGRPTHFARMMRGWPGFESDQVVDHFCRWTPRDFVTFRRMKPGDRYPEAVAIAERRYSQARRKYERGRGPRPRRAEFIPPYAVDSFPEKWGKLDPSKPSWTVTAHLAKDTYSHIHYDHDQARSISIREAARLQSFPDGYRFAGNMGDAFRQIGNAVPPLLAAAVAQAILPIAKQEAGSTSGRKRAV